MTIKIIKNAEMPKPRANYPFADMEVGDAFDYPGGAARRLRLRHSSGGSATTRQ